MLRLRELRKRCDLTMKEFGSRFGLAESTISQYETGKRQPDYEQLLKFSEYFGVSVDYLLGNSEEKAPTFRERVESELDDYSVTFLELAKDLSDENKEKLLELARLYLLDQEHNKG